MDFVADNLFNGRKIRALTIVDNFTRQCLAIHAGQSLKGEDVVAVMQRLHQELGLVPERIQVDKGSEFSSKALDRWAYDQHVTLDFSRPGKLRWSRLDAQKQDVYFLSHERRKEQEDAR